MTRAGRKPLGPQLVERLDRLGPRQAAFTGDAGNTEPARVRSPRLARFLGIGESMFHRLACRGAADGARPSGAASTGPTATWDHGRDAARWCSGTTGGRTADRVTGVASAGRAGPDPAGDRATAVKKNSAPADRGGTGATPGSQSTATPSSGRRETRHLDRLKRGWQTTMNPTVDHKFQRGLAVQRPRREAEREARTTTVACHRWLRGRGLSCGGSRRARGRGPSHAGPLGAPLETGPAGPAGAWPPLPPIPSNLSQRGH